MYIENSSKILERVSDFPLPEEPAIDNLVSMYQNFHAIMSLHPLLQCHTLLCWIVVHADATVFLQDAELDVLEGTNVSVCGEIELAGELLADINIEFLTIGGGPGAGQYA